MRSFTVPVPDLTAALVALVRQVPKGRVTTYGDLAAALGDRGATRWVAEALAEPPPAVREAAHRVVKATGEPGRSPPDALARLVAERVPVAEGRADLAARFRDFETDRPLARLKQEQEEIARRVRLTELSEEPSTVAAVDVSYRADGVGVAAYVLMEAGNDAPTWTLTVEKAVGFPYIPGYLSYRELPVHAELIRRVVEAGRVAPLLLVDGNGILHPRRTGIATQLGVLADHPTVGVSKHLLCGTVVMDGSFGEGTGRVVHRGETVAAALPPSRRGTRPIFVSPGHRCTLDDAVAVATAWRKGLKLPEPIRLADALSRSIAKGGLEAG
ncbi:MAG TPA: endonuclease V [Planctomycetaceae bacterium]